MAKSAELEAIDYHHRDNKFEYNIISATHRS